MKKIKKIILNIPHSSTNLSMDCWNINENDLDLFNELVLDKTDLKTDLIFHNIESKNISTIIGNVSRFYCDLERLENDTLENIGQGIIYTKYDKFNKIISDIQKQKIMNEVYYPYIDNIKNSLTENSLLIDCHSFSKEINSKIDINLGYNDDWSKPNKQTFDLIYNHFKEIGFTIGINEPYSNSLAPKTDFNYQSIMIELNKKLYLRTNNIDAVPDAYKLHYTIVSLYKKILGKNY